MYFLVHDGILRDDHEFRLAHEDRFVQVPGLWRIANSNANSNPDSVTNTDGHANTDTIGGTERAEQSDRLGDLRHNDQYFLDRQFG